MPRLRSCEAAVAAVASGVLVLLAVAPAASALSLGSPPVVDRLYANPSWIAPGGAATLTCTAHDTDGSIERYEWTAPAGSFPLGGITETTYEPDNSIAWTAPAGTGTYTISCKVYDDFGWSTTRTVDVEVSTANGSPTITSITAMPSGPVMPGAAVVISCTAADPDGDGMTYAWTSSAGTISGDTDADPWVVTYTAAASAGAVLVEVGVSDPAGATTYGVASIRVGYTEYDSSISSSLTVPIRVAASPWEEYYVVDRNGIKVVAPDGTALREFSGLSLPRAVAASASGEIYVAEGGTGAIKALDRAGGFLRFVAPAGSCSSPCDMVLDGAGKLYVVDSKAACVRIFDVSGGAAGQFGTHGSGPGQFDAPSGIAFDAANSRLLVSDQRNHRVQLFDMVGGYISEFGTSGSGPGEFSVVRGLVVDPKGRVLVADSFHGRLQALDGAGSWIDWIGSFGKGPGQLRIPNDVDVDPMGKVIVASMNNGRIEIFQLLDSTGAYAIPDSLIKFEATAGIGLMITVDGTDVPAPGSFIWQAGSSHAISVATTQGSGGTRYLFDSWSDGGARSHDIGPDVPTTYTVSFITEHQVTWQSNPPGAGTVSIVDGSWHVDGTMLNAKAQPTEEYQFSSWSGDLAGTSDPGALVMDAPKSFVANFTKRSRLAGAPGGGCLASPKGREGAAASVGLTFCALFALLVLLGWRARGER